MEQVVTIIPAMTAERTDPVSGGKLPGSLARLLGESEQQPQLSPGSRELSVETTLLPAWLFGQLFHYRESQHDLGPTIRSHSRHRKRVRH
ncbi:hypothetical protein TNCV_4972821 [Trichonephila clavipes]|nr:hypothetical protein TNCV_4972821 [Trichonephila clavipes]